MGEWKEYRFSDFVCINPTVKLPKENISFVEMKDLNESTRYCMPSQERPLSGGSRFEEGDHPLCQNNTMFRKWKNMSGERSQEWKRFWLY